MIIYIGMKLYDIAMKLHLPATKKTTKAELCTMIDNIVRGHYETLLAEDYPSYFDDETLILGGPDDGEG